MNDTVPLPKSLSGGWRRVSNPVMEAMGAHPDQCPSFVRGDGLFVTMTVQKEQDGKRWVHLSCSRRKKEPSYYDLCEAKEQFLGPDSLAMLLFVPTDEHVNIHPHCLHLWSCLDGRPTPDFTWGKGTI